MSPTILDRLPCFQRQAEVLAALNHPNVAAVYGLEKTSDLTALVMELVEGDELCGQIARGPIQLADALRIAKQIAEALEAAHEQGRRAAGAAGGQILFLASVSSYRIPLSSPRDIRARNKI
jgi:serine/threonine protein kinase